MPSARGSNERFRGGPPPESQVVSKAELTGDLCVGSAPGETWRLGRRRACANSRHSGNARLRELIKRDSSYPDHFRSSVLQILPKTMARDGVLECEVVYKQKLGTGATGLKSTSHGLSRCCSNAARGESNVRAHFCSGRAEETGRVRFLDNGDTRNLPPIQ